MSDKNGTGFKVDDGTNAADVAADLVVALGHTTGTVAAVADDELARDTSARCAVLGELVITATALVELAAVLTAGRTRERLEHAVDVLDGTPFGAGDWGEVDDADVLPVSAVLAAAAW